MPLSSFMENFLKRRQELEAQDKFDATLGEQQADRALQAQQLAESIKAREADDARMKADQDFRRSQATQTQQWDALVGMSQGKLERGPGLLTVAGPGILGIPDKVLPPPPGGMEVKDIGQLFPVPLDVQKRREVEAEIAGRRALVTENQKILNDFITKQRETGDPLPKDFEHRANLFIATGLQLPKEDIDDQIVRLWETEHDESLPPAKRQQAAQLRKMLFRLKPSAGPDISAMKYFDDANVAQLAGNALRQVNDLVSNPNFATDKLLQQQVKQRLRVILTDPKIPARFQADAMKQALTSLGLPSAFEESFMDMVGRMAGKK